MPQPPDPNQNIDVLGQKVDCDVCIAKAGQPCFIQTSAEQHRRTGDAYQSGNTFIGKERFHVGVRLKADTSVSTATSPDVKPKKGVA